MSTVMEQVRQFLPSSLSKAIETLPGRLEEVTVEHADSRGGLGRITATHVDSGELKRTVFQLPSSRGGFVGTDEMIDVTNFGDEMRSFVPINFGSAQFSVNGIPVEGLRIPDKPSTSMLRAMETPELAGDARQELAIAVEDLLGYTPLRKDAGAPSKLQRVLAELEITAFEQTSVDEYKRKMQEHFQSLASQRDGEVNQQRYKRIKYYEAPTLQITRVAWGMVKLKAYTKPVPEFVLRKAMQIKQHEPSAKFYVDELRENTITVDPFLIVKIGDDQAAIEVWDEPEFEKTL